MYAALWRILPGPWWVRLLILLVAAAAVVTALVLWVFPVIDQMVAPQDVTVDE
ncbi:hypothetical protein [Pseudolysinimonas yzui]|uniref:DUF4175 domain-containing protein n=1 Tax=Pseudolysinimonas yzui TaxID=2708254 RepID=A0A8J3GRZ6_9MICO|nr:hypothetical protein [Pseudolysinimonas yzui]GHF21344.1 hypothetical protein GCM10011600_22760 [Pseudolysinimonas yzui]